MARITVKGIPHDVEVAPETPLLSLLRQQLGLTGVNSAVRNAGTALDAARGGFCQADSHFSGMLHG
jgi:aerobic-type carbon monoxide dehydrogenase small subunit (CoxS/CutS family)